MRQQRYDPASRSARGFLLAAVLALAAGYALAQLTVGVMLAGDRLGLLDRLAGRGARPTTGAEDAPGSAVVAPPISEVYRIQAGIFSSRSNADLVVAKLTAAGWPAYLTGSGPFRVYAGVAASKPTAQAQVAQLTQLNIEGYASRQTLPALPASAADTVPEAYRATWQQVVRPFDAFSRALVAYWEALAAQDAAALDGALAALDGAFRVLKAYETDTALVMGRIWPTQPIEMSVFEQLATDLNDIAEGNDARARAAAESSLRVLDAYLGMMAALAAN